MNTTGLRQVVICEPLRTPIGRFGGAFKTVAPADLAAAVIAALIERTGLDGDLVDDVIFGRPTPLPRQPRSPASPP